MSEMKDKLLKYVSEKYHLGKLDISNSHTIDKAKFVGDIKHAVDDYHAELQNFTATRTYETNSLTKSFENTLSDNDLNITKQSINSESGIHMDAVVIETDDYLKVMVHASDNIFSDITGEKIDFADINLMKMDLVDTTTNTYRALVGDEYAFYDQFDVHIMHGFNDHVDDNYLGLSGVNIDGKAAISQDHADDYYYEMDYHNLIDHNDVSLVPHIVDVIDHA